MPGRLRRGADGATALAIAEGGRRMGLRVKGYSVALADFARIALPAIVHWKFNHFIVVIQAGEALGDPELHSRVKLMTGSILDSLTRDGWLCGVPLGVESTSLLNGLAGIAYGLLRIAEPSRMPAILALDPPMGSLSGQA